MKRKRLTRIAFVLGVSLLALSLFAGVALAAGGTLDRVRDKTKLRLCDGSCRLTSAESATAFQAGTGVKAQEKTRTRSQLRDGTCLNVSGTATETKTQARDQARSKTCDESCKTR